MHANQKITAIFVTHDESLIQFATRVIRIDSGKIISDEKYLKWGVSMSMLLTKRLMRSLGELN